MKPRIRSITPSRTRYRAPGQTLLAIGLGLLVFSGVARPAQAREVAPEPAQISDPLETLNRGMFGVDSAVNRLVAGPTRILGTVKWVPRPVRHGLFNAFENLEEPATLANDLMQRKVRRAGETTALFGVNLTVGVGGAFDIAKRIGLKRTREDFGQTLALYLSLIHI